MIRSGEGRKASTDTFMTECRILCFFEYWTRIQTWLLLLVVLKCISSPSLQSDWVMGCQRSLVYHYFCAVLFFLIWFWCCLGDWYYMVTMNSFHLGCYRLSKMTQVILVPFYNSWLQQKLSLSVWCGLTALRCKWG